MKNLLGQISILKVMEIKPNFSELAREYGVDRRTVKKYYEGYEGKPKTRNKQSKLDKYYDEIKAFANDFDFKIRLCKPRHSYTKGKVESSNKFINWLLPYNCEFEDEEDLIKIIDEINKKVNQSTNQSTGIQPIILFQKEKEYLSPLPSNDIIESYMNFEQKATVHKDSMIYYKYSRYSINKTVTLKTVENELHVYFNTDLISVHILSNKKINYHESHYRELIENLIKSKEDIEQICTNNLNELDKLLHR
ncbi:hypothetical protein [Thermoanaerobacterium sp. RBIITD]|uniref:hypothetical protein n=1 Tax=Thermoanaerobacterium sp. RBIITD TaxID=1550240 RepID=UPI000BB7F746|nr:hypothetical protein [Thermoanaerobacterium sp. RBIITD]